MSRVYKIDVLLDDHGAAEGLNKVAAAEDNVVSSSTKLGTTLDTVSAKQKVVVADTRGMDEAFGRSTVSAKDADYALSGMHVAASKLPSTFAEVRGGLNAIAEGAGLTVASLGMLGTAGLVVGTAITSWQLTRAVSEMTGLDGAIDKVVNTTRNWISGSQEMGARADTLAYASQRAGRSITDFSEALEINAQWQKEWMARAQEADNAVARLRAPRESAQQIADWQAEIEKVRSAGVLPSLTADIDSHNFSQKELADRYRISAGAISLFSKEIATAAANQSAWDKQMHADFEALVKATDDHTRAVAESLAKVRALEMGGDHAFSTLHQWYGEMARDQKYLNELADQNIQKMIATQAAAAAALDAEYKAALAQDAIYQQGARAGGVTSPNDGSNERGYGINQNPNIVPISQTGATPASRYTGATSLPGGTTGAGTIFSGVNYNPSAGPIRSFDVGGPTGQGGPAILHADEYVVPKDGALVKSGGSGSTPGSVIYLSIDAKGATFEDDRSLDRLTDKIATRLGVRAAQRGR